LIPWREGAFNIGAVVSIHFDENKSAIISLSNGPTIILSQADMVELEQTLKRKIETTQAIQKEAIRNNIKAQAEAVAELNSSVQPGMIVGAAPTGKRFRQ